MNGEIVNLTNVTYPLRLPRRVPRITGDTRRRKRRLREKRDKRDWQRAYSEIMTVHADMKRSVIDDIERTLFALDRECSRMMGIPAWCYGGHNEMSSSVANRQMRYMLLFNR